MHILIYPLNLNTMIFCYVRLYYKKSDSRNRNIYLLYDKTKLFSTRESFSGNLCRKKASCLFSFLSLPGIIIFLCYSLPSEIKMNRVLHSFFDY